jgi:integral membrane protein (TIGR01906 family)
MNKNRKKERKSKAAKQNDTKTKPVGQKILVIISAIALIFIILSASFFMVFFDKRFYDKSFTKYGAYDELGMQGVRNTVDYLTNYLISEKVEIEAFEELNIFLPAERSHLEDVWVIIHWVKAISVLSLILLIGVLVHLSRLGDFRENIRRILVYGAISTLALLVIVFALSLNFPSFFEGFHKLLFPHGNYTFPAEYLLIKLFPQGFFEDYARKMFFHSAILSLICLFLGSSSAFAVRNARRD